MDTRDVRPHGRSGRPRSRDADLAILRATIELIADSGIHAVSLDEVAARAHAGKDTIYRRWAHKDELIEAALSHAIETAPAVPMTDDPHADLLAHVAALTEMLARPSFAAVLRETIAEAPRDAVVAASLERFRAGHETALASLVVRCQGREESAASIGALLFRVLIGGHLVGTPDGEAPTARPGADPDPAGRWVVEALLGPSVDHAPGSPAHP